ncbi:MAG: FAD-binding oxidoreductase [Bacillati bacterium ANGP1]|uniref:FAD-binding oxidoreductase n=1 Tax=Candidatus Segetimicrobium genomatis TaxID=2569760 RepID=A0A537JGK0_9BACT|nr:MAG: FAD-binding oxidoreductase [Terrabacteria group bacterium ANGP1]
MTAALAGRAREIVGPDNLLDDPAALVAYTVDGIRPAAMARPATAEEAATLLAAAGEQGAGVLPRGAGAHQHLGGVPSRADLVIDTTRLTGGICRRSSAGTASGSRSIPRACPSPRSGGSSPPTGTARGGCCTARSATW